MFTITPRTRIREWVSPEDEDCYETGYEICDDNGEIIYDFADEDTKNYYEELNRQRKRRLSPTKSLISSQRSLQTEK